MLVEAPFPPSSSLLSVSRFSTSAAAHPLSFLSVLITNRFDRHFPPSPISPLLLLLSFRLRILLLHFPLSLSLSLFVEEIRYSLWNSCRLEITFNRGESRVLLSRESGSSQSFSLVFDLIGGYKSGTSLSFSLFRCPFLSERTTLF